MTQKDLFQTVTSSRRDTHANHSPSRESKKAQKMTATSGRTSLELLHKKDRLGAFSKTFMVTSPWVSTRCCLTWKPKATPQGRLLFQLAVSTLPTDETDSGLWATPNTMDHLPPRSEESTKKMQEGHRKGRARPSNLREQVDEKTMDLYVKNWPTPSASDVEGGTAQDVKLENNRFSRKNKDGVRWGVKLRDAVNHTEKMWPTPRANKVHPMITEENREQLANRNKSNLEEVVAGHMWPTPAASEGRQGYQDRTRGKKGSQKSLTTEVIDAAGGRQKVYGQLNPTWVEWLMGYPEGWTDLKD